MEQLPGILIGLQNSVRSQRKDERHARSFSAKLSDGSRSSLISIGPRTDALMDDAVQMLRSDLAYEHLSIKQAVAEVETLVYLALTDRNTNHVTKFLARNQRPIVEKIAWFSIELLTVETAIDYREVRIVPFESWPLADVLDRSFPGHQCRTVAEIPVAGTDFPLMAERGRKEVQFALDSLRVTLSRRYVALARSQLRFGTGEYLGVGSHYVRWASDSKADVFALTQANIDDELPGTMPDWDWRSSRNLDVQFGIALAWLRRSTMTDDLTERVVFLFAALESMLGEKEEGRKAQKLCFYRTLLAEVTVGRFKHPFDLYFQYEEVRSNAVHGSAILVLEPSNVSSLHNDITAAVCQAFDYARYKKLDSIADLLWTLRHDPMAPDVIRWLAENDAPAHRWTEFHLCQLDASIDYIRCPWSHDPSPTTSN